jgi:hypothetical protein
MAEVKPSKIMAFESELDNLLKRGQLSNEADIMRLCFEHGVKRQHAKRVLTRLKRDGVIALDFQVPDVQRFRSPRLIRRIGSDNS